MDSRTVDKLKHVSNTETIRRLLIKYFFDKGFSESFDRQLYPSILQDLSTTIPVLMGKIEVRPFMEDLDPIGSTATLGWNLFVLGNHRMYLGQTRHNNLGELARDIKTGLVSVPTEGISAARKQTTPRRVVTFITRVLGNNEAGFIDLSPRQMPMNGDPYQFGNGAITNGMGSQFQRSGYGT